MAGSEAEKQTKLSAQVERLQSKNHKQEARKLSTRSLKFKKSDHCASALLPSSYYDHFVRANTQRRNKRLDRADPNLGGSQSEACGPAGRSEQSRQYLQR